MKRTTTLLIAAAAVVIIGGFSVVGYGLVRVRDRLTELYHLNALASAHIAELEAEGLSLRGRPTPQQFGAVENDGQDDTAAILNAIANAPGLRFPGGTYEISEPLPIPTGADWQFDGVTLRASGEYALTASSTWGWTISGALKVQAQQGGVLIENPRGARIEAIEVQGADVGFTVQGAAQALPRADTMTIGSLRLNANDVGLQIKAGAGAEFVTIQEIEATGNKLAARVGAGNTKILGGNIVDNGDGLLFVSGANHGHGILSGTTIAHNRGFNLRFSGVTAGYVVLGNAIYGDDRTAGLVEIDHSQGITLTNSILSAHVVISDPVGPSVICGNFMPAGTASIVGGALLACENNPSVNLSR